MHLCWWWRTIPCLAPPLSTCSSISASQCSTPTTGTTLWRCLSATPRSACFFVDVRMPGMSGPELAEIVRQRRPDIKIVLTSGYVGEELLASDVHFVPKPWRVDQVAKAVGGCQA